MEKQIIISQECSNWLKNFGKDKVQAFQDSLAELLNISLCVLTLDGKSLTVWSNSSLFCHYMLNTNRQRCIQERQNVIKQVLEGQKTNYFTCYMGLTFFCSPIYSNNNIIAVLYGGGFLLNDNNKANTKLNVDVPILDEYQLKIIVQFIKNVFNLLNINSEVSDITFECKENSENLLYLNKRLSQREIDVVRLINDGKSNKEIAKCLYISEKTVKTHVSNILKKLELKDRMQIILACKQNNFL